MVAGRKVDREVRVDETMRFVEDRVADNIIFYGRTEAMDAADGDPVWQIKLWTRVTGEVDVVYADHGKYNQKWSDRLTLFGVLPAPEVTPSTEAYPVGLKFGGLVTVVTINDLIWTPLPAIALPGRNALCIQNESGVSMKMNYSPLILGYVGMTIINNGERFYGAQDDIVVYGKSQPGSGPVDINVEEIA